MSVVMEAGEVRRLTERSSGEAVVEEVARLMMAAEGGLPMWEAASEVAARSRTAEEGGVARPMRSQTEVEVQVGCSRVAEEEERFRPEPWAAEEEGLLLSVVLGESPATHHHGAGEAVVQARELESGAALLSH
jgi:hypothetical protein